MAEQGTRVRDVARLAVARVGKVEETGDRLMPFRLLDDHGVEVPAVTEFLHHMLADDASRASLRANLVDRLREAKRQVDDPDESVSHEPVACGGCDVM